MSSITLKRSFATLAAIAGVLAAAGPAAAQGGGADFTRLYSGPTTVFLPGGKPVVQPASVARMANADYCADGSPQLAGSLGTSVDELLGACITDGTSNTIQIALVPHAR